MGVMNISLGLTASHPNFHLSKKNPHITINRQICNVCVPGPSHTFAIKVSLLSKINQKIICSFLLFFCASRHDARSLVSSGAWRMLVGDSRMFPLLGGSGGWCPESVEAWDLKRGNGFAWHCSILWQWFSEHYLCGGGGGQG